MAVRDVFEAHRYQSDLTHEGMVELDGETRQIRAFIDKSLVECYVNGKQSVTTRTYLERSDADGLRTIYIRVVSVRWMDV